MAIALSVGEDAVAVVGLALWKAKIEEANARCGPSREACRIEIPGPAKDLILVYLQLQGNQQSKTTVRPGDKWSDGHFPMDGPRRSFAGLFSWG